MVSPEMPGGAEQVSSGMGQLLCPGRIEMAVPKAGQMGTQEAACQDLAPMEDIEESVQESDGYPS